MTNTEPGLDFTDIGFLTKEQRIDLILDGTQDYAVIALDTEGRVIEWGQAAANISGYEPNEAVGNKIDFLLTEEDQIADAFTREFAETVRTGKTECKRWYKRSNGTRFFANTLTAPIYNNEQELRGFAQVFKDETAQQRDAERRGLLVVLAHQILEAREIDAKLSKDVFAKIRTHLDADILFNYKITETGDLQLVAEMGVPAHLKLAAARLHSGQAFCGTVAATRQPLTADKARISEDAAGAFICEMGATAYACHPLFGRDGKVLGTFSVASTTRDNFSPSEIEFLQTISHFMAIAWDRQQAEARLATLSAEASQRKRLYETILSNTPDLAYVWDLNHRFTYANEILLKLWGKTWDEAVGKNCLELGYEPWHAEMHDREIEQVKKTKRPVRGIVPFAGTFGHRIYDYILVPVFGPNGDVEAVAGTTRDITELKNSQEETAKLLEAEKQHALLIGKVAKASTSLNSLLSAKSIAKLVSEEARSIIGAHYSLASIASGSANIQSTSTSDKYLVGDDYSDQFERMRIYTQVCADNRTVRVSQLDDTGAGSDGLPRDATLAECGLLAVPLIGKGETNLGMLQLSDKYIGDFTADDEAVLVQLATIAVAGIENASMYEKLRDQDRRKDEFLATLAHELRNPLAPIRSALAVLAQTTLPEQSVKTISMMERQVNHMVHLIDDLLDVSRISVGKIYLQKEHIPFEKVVLAAIELSRPAVEENAHELKVSNRNTDTLLDVDPIRIAQIISNLINNAAKYTPKGGLIEISADRDGGHAVITVRDNGIGIPPESTSEIFELFTQAGKTLDRAQGGLGIGLAISRQLIEMHGGSISAYSEGAGKGATFTLRLPISTDQSIHSENDGKVADHIDVPSHRILVVDDNIDAADMLTMVLQLSGHNVETVYNGFDALELASTYKPELVFLDIGLPGMSGYEVAQQMLSNESSTKPILVALTGWGASEDLQRAQDAGFHHHFTKPVEIKKIEQLLERIWAEPIN